MNRLKLILFFIQARWLRKFKTTEQLQKYQENALKRQYQYMKENSPYYAELPADLPFPKMDKHFMMTHFDLLNTKGIQKKEALAFALNSEKTRDFTQNHRGISIGLSSGTSGHQGIFITSQEEQALWAGTVLAKMLPKRKILGHKLAFFLRADNQLYQSIHSKMIQLAYFDMYQPLNDHISRLNDYQPSILIAPASMLIALASAVEKGILTIQPQRVISVAEVLEKTDSLYLQTIFQLPVIHQIYQCTEGFLGCTCEFGHLHLNEDIVYIEKEYLDEERFYPIITDFKRTSQPIINYKLNDILVQSNEPCPCGSLFQRIEKIEGRADDIFLFTGINGAAVSVFPDFIRRCILFVPDIREYQVTQLSRKKIEIAIEGLTSEQKKQLCEEFNQLAIDFQFLPPEINFIPYQWNNEVKLKRVARIFKEEVTQ